MQKRSRVGDVERYLVKVLQKVYGDARQSRTILAPAPVRDADTRIGLGSAMVEEIGNMKKALDRVWVGEDLFRDSGFKQGVWLGC